jgi:hypothetical protein
MISKRWPKSASFSLSLSLSLSLSRSIPPARYPESRGRDSIRGPSRDYGNEYGCRREKGIDRRAILSTRSMNLRNRRRGAIAIKQAVARRKVALPAFVALKEGFCL